ncbi:MAG: tyrosine-type recombinase/integrase [Candidatus Eisenbacteria bacterium]|nr:tyrosine-type recombinase/integrase [Candidatus Eisenbacteria bacterium]
MKLSTAIMRFDTQLRADGKSERTRQAYLRDLGKLQDWLGTDGAVTAINPNTLARFLADGNGKPKSALTVNRTKTALRVFFRFLSDAGYLSENPARLIRSTPTDRRVPSYLSIDEARGLLDAITNSDSALATRDHAMFSLLLGTGIRLGSLVALNVCDVNLAEGTVTIKVKGGREETVFLNKQLCRLLGGYVRPLNATDGTPLFSSRHGGRLGPRQVQLRLKHWLANAGIARPLSIHSLRHTFATRLYSKTGDLRLVQRALGHKHITTTEIYARVEDSALRKALENLSL